METTKWVKYIFNLLQYIKYNTNLILVGGSYILGGCRMYTGVFKELNAWPNKVSILAFTLSVPMRSCTLRIAVY